MISENLMYLCNVQNKKDNDAKHKDVTTTQRRR